MEVLTLLEGQVDEVEKERNAMICQLEENDEDITKLKSEFTSLKAQSCEATRMKEAMENHLEKKDGECKMIKEEIDLLKKEVDHLNKSLKSSQTLDDIESHQRSPLDKSGLGFACEPSSRNDANPNASNNKDVEKLGRNIDNPSSNKSKEKSQDDIRRNPTPRRYADGVKNARGNNFDQRIPRHNDFRSTSRQSPSSRYQSILFGYCYSCTNFGHMAKDCRAYHKDKYNESKFSRIHAPLLKNKMDCFKCHNIGHVACDCNLTWLPKQVETCLPSKKRKLHRYGEGRKLDQKAS